MYCNLGNWCVSSLSKWCTRSLQVCVLHHHLFRVLCATSPSFQSVCYPFCTCYIDHPFIVVSCTPRWCGSLVLQRASPLQTWHPDLLKLLSHHNLKVMPCTVHCCPIATAHCRPGQLNGCGSGYSNKSRNSRFCIRLKCHSKNRYPTTFAACSKKFCVIQ